MIQLTDEDKKKYHLRNRSEIRRFLKKNGGFKKWHKLHV